MKKTICEILCAALALVMLAACSSKKEISEPMPTPDPASTTAPAAAQDAANTSAPDATTDAANTPADTANDNTDHSTDYSGVYYETKTGHGVMNISGSPDHYDISVDWSFNPGENTCWTFSGTFDSSGTLNFSDCAKVTTTYYENGEIQDSTTEYAWASGSLSTVGGAEFVWSIPQDSAVSGSVFQQVG